MPNVDALNQAYQILSVTPETPFEQIKKRYKKLSLKYHPDKNPDVDLSVMQEITAAYQLLVEVVDIKPPRDCISSLFRFFCPPICEKQEQQVWQVDDWRVVYYGNHLSLYHEKFGDERGDLTFYSLGKPNMLISLPINHDEILHQALKSHLLAYMPTASWLCDTSTEMSLALSPHISDAIKQRLIDDICEHYAVPPALKALTECKMGLRVLLDATYIMTR